jgi:thioredoxin-related protein
MKTLFMTMVLAMAIVTLNPGTAPAHGGEKHTSVGADYAKAVKWTTLADGLELARKSHKPLYVDFGMPGGCSRCEFLKNNVYNRQKITDKINADFVPVWINLGKELTEQEESIGKRFEYEGECLLLFLDPEGNILTDLEGKKMCYRDNVEPEVIIKHLDSVTERLSLTSN